VSSLTIGAVTRTRSSREDNGLDTIIAGIDATMLILCLWGCHEGDKGRVH
jgi:hypothetical protein